MWTGTSSIIYVLHIVPIWYCRWASPVTRQILQLLYHLYPACVYSRWFAALCLRLLCFSVRSSSTCPALWHHVFICLPKKKSHPKQVLHIVRKQTLLSHRHTYVLWIMEPALGNRSDFKITDICVQGPHFVHRPDLPKATLMFLVFVVLGNWECTRDVHYHW